MVPFFLVTKQKSTFFISLITRHCVPTINIGLFPINIGLFSNQHWSNFQHHMLKANGLTMKLLSSVIKILALLPVIVSAFDVVSIGKIKITMTSDQNSETDSFPSEVMANTNAVSRTPMSKVLQRL